MHRTALEDKLENTKRNLLQHEQNVAAIQDLLKKADRRRCEEPDNSHRWNRVLDNLERCLDEAKAHVGRCQLEIGRIQRTLQDEQESADRTDSAPPQSESMPLEAPSATTLDAARRILSMSVEEMSALTLEEVALLHGQLANENVTLIEQDTAGVLSRIELANQLQAAPPPSASEDTGAPERRRQVLLRGAIDKICAHQLHNMTEEEARLVISTHALLVRRLTSNPKDERLKHILGAAVNILSNRLQAEKRSKGA